MSLLKKFTSSRKFWATLVGFVTVLGTSLEDGILTSQETTALAGIIIGYVFSVAFEDGMTNHVNWNSVNWNSLISSLQQQPPTTTETVTPVPETGTTIETLQVSEGFPKLNVYAQRKID